jgi:hypothetical protein
VNALMQNILIFSSENLKGRDYLEDTATERERERD